MNRTKNLENERISAREQLKAFLYENAELEQFEDLIDDFNIFTTLDIVNNEIRHSNFLSWLMNPQENHGLGDYFLKLFFKKISYKATSLGIEEPSIFDIDSWSFDDAEILREWRNIDILIKHDAKKFICVVENKVLTKEHSKQLRRYKNFVRNEFPKYQKMFVYLTIEGDIPSESEYIPLSYGDITQIADHVIKRKTDVLGSEFLAFISHYKEMLRRYVMKDSEIQALCRKIYKRHKKALELIFEYKPDKALEIKDCLVQIIQNDTDLILDDSTKSYIRFIPKSLDFVPKKGGGWTKSKRVLLLEVKNEPKGASLDLIIGPGPKEIRERLYEIAKENLSLFNRSNRKLTQQWFTIYKKAILSSKRYEDMDIEEIRKALEDKLKEFKSLDLPKIEMELRRYAI